MGLDRALGDVQILRDFCVVASLQQKLDDLLLPALQLAELLVHVLHLAAAHGTLPGRWQQSGSDAHLEFGSFPCLSIRAAKSTENR